jgi:hypothetical protein
MAELFCYFGDAWYYLLQCYFMFYDSVVNLDCLICCSVSLFGKRLPQSYRSTLNLGCLREGRACTCMGNMHLLCLVEVL